MYEDEECDDAALNDVDPWAQMKCRIKSLKLIIFIQETFEFLINLISMLLYIATILKAYFVWS